MKDPDDITSFRLTFSTSSYGESLDRITAPDYEPTFQDILHELGKRPNRHLFMNIGRSKHEISKFPTVFQTSHDSLLPYRLDCTVAIVFKVMRYSEFEGLHFPSHEGRFSHTLSALEGWLDVLNSEKFPLSTHAILLVIKGHLVRPGSISDWSAPTQEQIASKALDLRAKDRRFSYVGFIGIFGESNVAQLLKEVVSDLLERVL